MATSYPALPLDPDMAARLVGARISDMVGDRAALGLGVGPGDVCDVMILGRRGGATSTTWDEDKVAGMRAVCAVLGLVPTVRPAGPGVFVEAAALLDGVPVRVTAVFDVEAARGLLAEFTT